MVQTTSNKRPERKLISEEAYLPSSAGGPVSSDSQKAPLRDRRKAPSGPFEQLVSPLSVKLINATAEDVDREINVALEQVREVFEFDRLSLVTVSLDRSLAILTHSAHVAGISPDPENNDISLLFPWAKKRLLSGDMVYFTSLSDLPPQARIDRDSWNKLGVQSLFAFPIHVAGLVKYFIAASHVRPSRPMETAVFPRLRLLGEMFANALLRCKAEDLVRSPGAEGYHPQKELISKTESVRPDLPLPECADEIVGQSQCLARVLTLTEQVAPTDSTVLIYGETGTGKELVAQRIHRLSLRRNQQMVKVNCASLPAALVESELFGREKGAYTGALTRQAGRFEVAHEGTIFLDEIAEMSLELQAKLLRVLQEGQFERLGSTKTVKVDVRVIAATNRDLTEEVKKGTFREDLFYRLNVFQITVPPLRERTEDIPLLVWAFVKEFREKMGKQINKVSQKDMAALESYSWPGNVRELRNVIEHAAIVSTSDKLQVRVPEARREEPSGIQTLEDYETMHIREALRLTGGRIKGDGGAAALLGLNPSTLYSRMQKLGINPRNVKDEMSP